MINQLKMGVLVKVSAKIIDKKTGNPFDSKGLRFKLFDKDLLMDDFLGESTVNENGEVSVTFDIKEISSFDSPFETKPDLYFILYNYGQIIHKSKVLDNVPVLDKKYMVSD